MKDRAHGLHLCRLHSVRQLTPMSLDYEGHDNVFVSGCAAFMTLFVYYLVDAKSLRQG